MIESRSYFVANVFAEAADRAAHHAADISHPETNPRAHTAHQEPHRDAHGDTNAQPHTAAKPAADCCADTHADAEADVQPYASTDALAQTRAQGLQGKCPAGATHQHVTRLMSAGGPGADVSFPALLANCALPGPPSAEC